MLSEKEMLSDFKEKSEITINNNYSEEYGKKWSTLKTFENAYIKGI